MDFQSAMETFAEAWVAANAGPQSQALALTRAANAAVAAAAAANKTPSANLADIALKKEHSLSPPHSVNIASTPSSIDEGTSLFRRRPSLQDVQDKLSQLQMQQNQQQQLQQQQQQQLQLQQQQHQDPQTPQQPLQPPTGEQPPSPRYSTSNSGSSGLGGGGGGGGSGAASVGSGSGVNAGRRSSDLSSPVRAHSADNAHSTGAGGITGGQSATHPVLASTPKLCERDEQREVRSNTTVGSITCLPPAALNAGLGGQATMQAEKLLPSPAAMDSRREFDASKVNSKSLPLHCVVESVHSLQASLTIDTRNPWKRRPNIETDSYVIIAANTPWSEIVQTALQRLGYSLEAAHTARGSIIIKNWKPIPLEQISDNPVVPVCDIIGELTSVVTLRIVILRTKPSPFGEIKDKLLKLLVLQSHTVLRSTGCPLDEMTLSQICRSSYQNTYAFPGSEISEDLRRKFDHWWASQLSPQASLTPKMLPFMSAPPSVPNVDMDFPVGTAAVAAAAAAAAAAQAGLHVPGNVPGTGNLSGISGGISASRESLLMNDGSHHGAPGGPAANAHHPNMMVHPAMHASMHHHHHHHPHSQYPPNQKTRMRTSFDPEMELPKLQKWFQENPHPSRQQIQTYVVQLNALESRRGRKPLDVNNVVYWFKNARAAQKRAEMRGGGLAALGHASLNGFVLSQHAQMGQNSSSSAGSQQMGSAGNMNLNMSHHDYLKSPLSLKSEDVDTMSQHSDDIDDDQSRPNSPQLPLSLTTHERNRNSPTDEGVEGSESKHDADTSLKSDTDCRDMLNGVMTTPQRSLSRSYNEDETSEAQQHKLTEGRGVESGAHNENSNERTPPIQQQPLDSDNNNSRNSPNNNNNNNNEQTNEHISQAHSSPKQLTSPKEEEDELDMDDDDDDNENDNTQLDEFRSPSPDLANAMAQRKDLPFPMVPNSMFSQSFMYMSHYMPGFGQAAAAGHPHAHHAAAAAAAAGMQQSSLLNSSGLNLSGLSNEERRKRNRTFIDPVTEVPKLEQWFAMNTHPSHNLILKYTEDLNTMPYRQKFPRLESKNVQFWFKNRRAKCKRLKMSLYDNSPCSQLSGLNSFVHKYEERD